MILTSTQKRTWLNQLGVVVPLVCLAGLLGCGSPSASPPTAAPANVVVPTRAPGTTVVEQDEAYYQFGAVLPLESPDDFWRYDPHSVARYSVQLCREGRTTDLLDELNHVEIDAEQGRAFAQFVEMFGPDLERYRGRSISLRFVGVRQKESISVWYYLLLDEKGQPLDDSSWITVHRSKTDGRCALAGVFVNQFGEQPVYMPEDLITSR